MNETTTANEADAWPDAAPLGIMVAQLRGRAVRCRTGLLLLPPTRLAEAPDMAARLGIDALDYAQALVRALPSEAVFVPLTAESEEARLDEIAEDTSGADCVLIYNLDLAVARLETRQRALLWGVLRDRLPRRRRALVLAMPAGAYRLLPTSTELNRWCKALRLAHVKAADL